jgi:flagellar biosynthesis protein
MKMNSQKAAALKYDPQQHNAPKVLAKGRGVTAQKIIQKAKEYDIALFSNEALVDSLLDLEVDREIPRELYQAVSELFVWLAKVDAKATL